MTTIMREVITPWLTYRPIRDGASTGAWFFWCYIAGFTMRGDAYRRARDRHLSPAQAAEVWKYLRDLPVLARIGFFSAITPGSEKEAVEVARARVDGAYFLETNVDFSFLHADRRSLSKRSALSSPWLGSQDIIDLSFAGVPVAYARPLAFEWVDSSCIVDAYKLDIPPRYVLAAIHADSDPIEQWNSGVPFEYLV